MIYPGVAYIKEHIPCIDWGIGTHALISKWVYAAIQYFNYVVLQTPFKCFNPQHKPLPHTFFLPKTLNFLIVEEFRNVISLVGGTWSNSDGDEPRLSWQHSD